jgi:RNA polymerase sigma factor (sigma-70 family)
MMATTKLGAVLQHIRTAATGASPEHTDGELLRAFLDSNDPVAFAAIVRRHGPLVLRVCRHALRHEQDAEDVCQATFLILAQRAASIRKTESLASWLHGVALRMATNARRTAARRRKHEQQAGASGPADPAWKAAWHEVQAILDEEAQALPETYLVPFVLCCLEQRSCAEVAFHLGLREATVRNRLTRARRMLARRLDERGVTLTGVLAALAVSPDSAPAPLSGALVSSIAQAAADLAAGHGLTAGQVPAKVLAFMQGVDRAMILTRVKALVLFVLTVGVAVSGMGFAIHQRANTIARSHAAAPSQAKEVTSAEALDRSLEAAEKIHPDVARAKVLADIAVVRGRAGDVAGAKKTLEKATRLADGIQQADRRTSGLAAIGLAHSRLGQPENAGRTFRRAIAAARSAEHPLPTMASMGEVARALAATRDTRWAWETWEGILQDHPQAKRTFANTTADLSASLAEAGDIARARSALAAVLRDGGKVEQSTDGWVSADAAIAEALLARGEKEEARALVTAAVRRVGQLPNSLRVGPPPGSAMLPRPEAVAKLAAAQARVGDRPGAIKSLEQAQTFLADAEGLTGDFSLNRKVGCLARIATAWAAIGKPERAREPIRLALQAAEEIKHPSYKQAALAEVAVAQSRRGDWAGAFATLRTFGPGSPWGYQVVERLSEAGARAGKGKEVAALARALTDPLLRSRAYLGLARGLTKEKAPPPVPPGGRGAGQAELPARALPATKDLTAICNGFDAAAAAWKKQTSWLFRYVYSGVTVDPAPGMFGGTAPNEMINARKGDWLAGREATFVLGGGSRRLHRWHVWRDGKYTTGEAAGAVLTEDNPRRLGNCLYFANGFGLDNLPVPLMESSLREDRQRKPHPDAWKQAARAMKPMFLLQRWFRDNAAKYRARAELEPIDGHPCHVIEWPGRDVVWVDAAAGFSVRRRIIRRPSGAVDANYTIWGYQEMRPGMWIPLRIDALLYNPEHVPARYRGKVAKTLNTTLLEARFGKDVPDELFEVPKVRGDRKE